MMPLLLDYYAITEPFSPLIIAIIIDIIAIIITLLSYAAIAIIFIEEPLRHYIDAFHYFRCQIIIY
jgi:hypothetical protein